MSVELKEYNFMAWIEVPGGRMGDRWRLEAGSLAEAFWVAQQRSWEEQDEMGRDDGSYTRFEVMEDKSE